MSRSGVGAFGFCGKNGRRATSTCWSICCETIFAVTEKAVRPTQCPPCPDSDQISALPRNGAMGQTRALTTSLDDLIGAAEQCWRYGKAQRLRRLEIDYQLEFLGSLNREVCRSGAAKNTINVICSLQNSIAAVDAIRHKRACVCVGLECKY